jgi:toxin ParE1/3/4
VQVERRPAFIDDLTRAYSFLADHNPTVADRLLDEVEITIDLLSVFPALGRPRDDLRKGLRSIRLQKFPFIVFYRASAQRLVLLRILHGARDHRRVRLN